MQLFVYSAASLVDQSPADFSSMDAHQRLLPGSGEQARSISATEKYKAMFLAITSNFSKYING